MSQESFINHQRILSDEHDAPAQIENQAESDIERTQLVVFFAIFGLFVGGILRGINKSYGFPYTPMVVLYGCLVAKFGAMLDVIGESSLILSKINPHMLLFIFIPVLIFESGFNMSWYVFKRCAVNILILAAPGVLWGAVLLAGCFKYILGYGDDEISWNGAFMLGSVLSATDPVAVVALLKELGASTRYNVLVEGEALLNDGTAMVFYQLFSELAKGNQMSVISVSYNFVRNACGGPLLGIIIGIFGSFWLRRVIRDDVLTTIITFVLCYILFWLAEFTFIHVSGILAIVSLGLFMSAFGKTNIYSESEHAVHTIWSFVQYACETLIFLLTGILIGTEMFTGETYSTMDWIRLFAFWILCNVMRYVMVFTFLPFIKCFGYGINNRELMVLCYGGLRGALGITLALMVSVDSDLPKRLRKLTLFYMAGTAFLTLILNGTTCRSIVEYVKMVECPPIKTKILKNSLRDLILSSNKKEDELKSNKYFQLAEWSKVEQILEIEEIQKNISDLDNQEFNANMLYDESQVIDGMKVDDIMSETRFRFLRTLKVLFWERFENGGAGAEPVRMLEESCNFALDNTIEQLNLWDQVFKYFTGFKLIKLFFKIRNVMYIGNVAKQIITNHLAFIYDISTTFIICAEEAKELQRDLPLSQACIDRLVQEVNLEIGKAEEYVDSLQESFPEIIKAVHSKRAAQAILEHHKKFLNQYKDKGYIDESDYNNLRNKLDKKMMNLMSINFNWKVPDFQFFVMEFPIFHSLEQEQVRVIRNAAKEVRFKKGMPILAYNQKVDQVYVITKGTVEDKISETCQIRYGIGAILSYGNLTSPNQVAISTAMAQTDVKLIQIPYQLMLAMMKKNNKFEEKVYRNSLVYNVKHNPGAAGVLASLSELSLNEISSSSIYYKLDKGENITLEYGGYLFVGSIQTATNVNAQASQTKQENFRFTNMSFIKADQQDYIALEKSILIKFIKIVDKRESVKHILHQDLDNSAVKQYEQYMKNNSTKIVQNNED